MLNNLTDSNEDTQYPSIFLLLLFQKEKKGGIRDSPPLRENRTSALPPKIPEDPRPTCKKWNHNPIATTTKSARINPKSPKHLQNPTSRFPESLKSAYVCVIS